MTMPRVEVITSVERRRRWSREEKERLVVASFEPGVTASEVARSAGIHVSQLFRWRKELCDRVDVGATQLVPVEIVPAAQPPVVETPASSRSSLAAGAVSVLIATWMARRCGACWTRSGCDDPGSERRAGVAGDGSHRHEEGLSGPGIGSAGDAEA